MSSNENLQMHIIGETSSSSIAQKSSNVQFIGDSPITDPGRKVCLVMLVKIFFGSRDR